MSEFETILVEKLESVGLIRLNRPESLNSLNNVLLDELMTALEQFDRDTTVGTMVITGNDKAFAAGADIRKMVDSSPFEMLLESFIDQFDRLQKVHKPVIAAVSGWCLGGGCELAMACDLIIASETARFGQPEINLGVIPGAGGTQRLTRAVGKAIAMEMILNNRTLTAAEAYQFGLINHVFPLENYLDEAIAIAAELAKRPPLAVRLGKEAVNHAYETSLSEGILAERRAFYFLFASDDQKEGMRAFIEKRKPEWKGS